MIVFLNCTYFRFWIKAKFQFKKKKTSPEMVYIYDMKWVCNFFCRTAIIMQTLCLNKQNSNPLLSDVILNAKWSKNIMFIFDRSFLLAIGVSYKKKFHTTCLSIWKNPVSIVIEQTNCVTKKRTVWFWKSKW